MICRTLINELKPGTIERQRTIAIAGCSYSHVIQCRSWLPDEVGAIAWFSFDNPGESPRIPIFSGTLSLPSVIQYLRPAALQDRCCHLVVPGSQQTCNSKLDKEEGSNRTCSGRSLKIKLLRNCLQLRKG